MQRVGSIAYAFIPAPFNPPWTGSVVLGNFDIAGSGIPSMETSPPDADRTTKDAVAAAGLAAVPNTMLPTPTTAVAGTVVVMAVPAPLMVNGVASAVPIFTEVTLESAVPLTVTVAPTSAAVGTTLVIVGSASGTAPTVRVMDCVAVAVPVFADMVKVLDPMSTVRGMPQITPRFALRVAHSGVTPAITVQPPDAMVWEAVNGWQ